MDLSLTTPVVETETTNHYKILDVAIGNCEDENGPYASVTVSCGELSGEEYTENSTERIRVSTEDVATYLGALADNSLSILDYLKKALFTAMQANGDLGAGTIS